MIFTNPVRPQLLFAGACCGMLVFGIVFAILGTVFGMPEMRVRLGIDLARQGNLFLLLYLGVLVASLAIGPIIDRAGKKVNLVVSSTLVAVAMLLFAISHSFVAASIAAIILGLGGGGLNTCTNALVSDLYGERRGPMLNLLGIFFGVGALLIPLLAAGIQGRVKIPQLLLFCSALAALCTLAYSAISFPGAKLRRKFSWRETLGVAKYPGVLLLAFVLFFESGNEASIAGWTSTYSNTMGFSPRMASLVLASYWATLMLSRVLVAAVLPSIGKAQLLVAAALMSLAGCAILLSASSLVLLFAGTSLIGLACGPIYPTTLAIAGDRYSNTGTVFGLLFSIALLGGMTFPWVIGQVSQRAGVRIGMVVPLLGTVGICILAGRVIFREHKIELASTREQLTS